MKKKSWAMPMIFFLMILATSALAQSSGPADQGARPGPGYGMGPGGGYGYGPGYGPGYGWGPGMMGPGWGGYGMGPGMMGQGYGYGMGPGMMGPGYGYGWGPGYGYGRGEGESYANLPPEEREARAKAFVQEYIRRYLPGYSLEKKEPAKKK